VISITGASRLGEMRLMVSPVVQRIVSLEPNETVLTSLDVGIDPAFLEVNHSSNSMRNRHHKSLEH